MAPTFHAAQAATNHSVEFGKAIVTRSPIVTPRDWSSLANRFEAASNSEAYRLPELFEGFSRTQFETPVPYPVACQPQAWAAGAIPYLVTCGLGIVPDGLRRRLRIRRPSLPSWLNRVEVRGLRIAGARVDLLFERAGVGEQVALTDARIDGDVEVVLEITGTREPRGGRY